jgi:ankyrin repeat protein
MLLPADPSADDNYAFFYAAGNGHVQVARLILQAPDFDPTRNKRLYYALAQ